MNRVDQLRNISIIAGTTPVLNAACAHVFAQSEDDGDVGCCNTHGSVIEQPARPVRVHVHCTMLLNMHGNQRVLCPHVRRRCRPYRLWPMIRTRFRCYVCLYPFTLPQHVVAHCTSLGSVMATEAQAHAGGCRRSSMHVAYHPDNFGHACRHACGRATAQWAAVRKGAS